MKILLISVLVDIVMLGGVFTSNNYKVNARHERGHGLDFPDSVAIDSNGNVFVGIDAGGLDRIQKFSNSGKFIKEWDTPAVRDISIDKSGNVFVVGGVENTQIIKYNNNGKFIRQWEEHNPSKVSASMFG